ncbi:MAG: hypothetical protein OHK0045_15200 [Raineya sp.]
MQNKWVKIIAIGAIVVGVLVLTKGKFLQGGAMLIAGVSLHRWARRNAMKSAPSDDFQLTDDMIVRFANLRGGIISANELASQSSLNVEQAKERLEKLLQQDLAVLRVSDNGSILYDFTKNYLSSSEKEESEII